MKSPRVFARVLRKVTKKHWGSYLRDVRAIRWFLEDYHRFGKLSGIPLTKMGLNIWLQDKTTETPFVSSYFYQNQWAFESIRNSKVSEHVDVGSLVEFVGLLSIVTNVTFIDLRPIPAQWPGLTCKKGSILSLPYPDQSIVSLSCLHVAEHIGLGRYGDPIDVQGTQKAAIELQRVLAPGGSLYFSVPVGQERVYFNAHRVFSPHSVPEMFTELDMVEFAGVTDRGIFLRPAELKDLNNELFGCGLYHFVRPSQ